MLNPKYENQRRYYRKIKYNLTFNQKIIRNLRAIKQKAKRAGIEFNITFKDLKINKVCPVLGIPLSFDGEHSFRPSIDRMDITKGYIPGNVRIISHRANRWKNDMTLEDATLLINNWDRR